MTAPNGSRTGSVSLSDNPLVYGVHGRDPGAIQQVADVVGENGDSILELSSDDLDDIDDFSYEDGQTWMHRIAKHTRQNDWDDTHVVGQLPDPHHKRIEDLRASDIGSLVSIECRVTDCTEQFAVVGEAIFRCSDCGEEYERIQNMDSMELNKPNNCECGAGKRALDLKRRRSEMVDTQQLITQDLHTASSTPDPSEVRGNVHNFLVGEVEPGETVTLTAIVRATETQDIRKAMKSELYLQVVGVQHHDEDFAGVEISDEEEEKIREIATSDDVYQRLEASIAPSLSGDYSLARRALGFQLFGAVSHGSDHEKHREQIHIALVGDPGSGKSMMGRYVEKIAPTGVYQSADNVTEVGLTAAVSREDRFDSSEWTLSGGTLVRADGGLAVIDELDKAPEAIQSSLQEPLSEQQVSISKGPISATLPARCSSLLIANPEGERFSVARPIAEQINIRPAIWDRMDVIIPFADRPDEERDDEMADAILDRASGETPDHIEPDLIRKWVAFARENVDPQIIEEAREFIKEEWVSLRSLSEGSRVSVGARQLDSIIRLSEASARIRLSETVEQEDAERAADMMSRWMSLLMTDTNGEWSVDSIGDRDASQMDIEDAMWTAISDLGDSEGAPRSDVVEAIIDGTGVERAEAQQAINKFVGRGDLKQENGALVSGGA